MAGVRGWLNGLAGNSLAMGATLLLHGAAAFIFLRSHAAPRPSAPPQLLTDSLELTLAEVESDVVQAAESQETVQPLPAPQPSSANYLLASGGDFALPELPPPTPAALPELPLPTIPDLPESNRLPHETRLPEITLPPAEVKPAQTSRTATGATARLEKPRLVTDLSRLRKHYPPQARRNGWEGIAIVALEIAADGELIEARIQKSSGYRILDEAALKMMRSAKFTGGPGSLLQPLEFKLK